MSNNMTCIAITSRYAVVTLAENVTYSYERCYSSVFRCDLKTFSDEVRELQLTHNWTSANIIKIQAAQQHKRPWTSRHTHARLTVLFTGLPGWAGTRNVKPIWILLKQETVSGSGISWDICKSAPRSRQITTPTPHHLVFYRPDTLPAVQPTASKHWRQADKIVFTAK